VRLRPFAPRAQRARSASISFAKAWALSRTAPPSLLAASQGLDAAVRHVRGSGIKLCALGADGEVLWREFGLEVHVSPPEASTSGLVAELRRRGISQGTRVLAPVPLVTGAPGFGLRRRCNPTPPVPSNPPLLRSGTETLMCCRAPLLCSCRQRQMLQLGRAARPGRHPTMISLSILCLCWPPVTRHPSPVARHLSPWPVFRRPAGAPSGATLHRRPVRHRRRPHPCPGLPHHPRTAGAVGAGRGSGGAGAAGGRPHICHHFLKHGRGAGRLKALARGWRRGCPCAPQRELSELKKDDAAQHHVRHARLHCFSHGPPPFGSRRGGQGSRTTLSTRLRDPRTRVHASPPFSRAHRPSDLRPRACAGSWAAGRRSRRRCGATASCLRPTGRTRQRAQVTCWACPCRWCLKGGPGEGWAAPCQGALRPVLSCTAAGFSAPSVNPHTANRAHASAPPCPSPPLPAAQLLHFRGRRGCAGRGSPRGRRRHGAHRHLSVRARRIEGFALQTSLGVFGARAFAGFAP
jgi:hypothetical protein